MSHQSSLVINHTPSSIWQLRWWIAGALLVLLVHTFLVVRLAVVQKRERAANKSPEEARLKLSGLLITAQEQERASIARELHDHINQRLALIAIELQQLTQLRGDLGASERAKLERLFALTTDVSHDVQSLSHHLHSSQLQHLGLLAAVRSLCEECSRTGLATVCTSTGVPGQVDPDLSLAMFRVVQESLRNAGKYSCAKVVKVELHWTPGHLSLCVADDGIGFDPAVGVEAGLGLISMQERLRLVGGELTITSAPGKGTRIEAHAPLSQVHRKMCTSGGHGIAERLGSGE